jgi:thiamine-phosphate pyrophosphorylase
MAPRPSDISPHPILCAVLDARALGPKPEAFARGLFEAGVDWIQLRDRSLSAESLLEQARRLVAARDEADREAPGAGTKRRVIVNRRVDIARAAGADGVHLGFDALTEGAVRELLSEDAVIGHSLHSLAEVESQAGLDLPGLRYGHLAPIWDPISKKASRPALGLDLLERACAFGLPILAQGGIDIARAAEVVAVGAAGVAVTGIISGASVPTDVARQLRCALDGHFRPEQ